MQMCIRHAKWIETNRKKNIKRVICSATAQKTFCWLFHQSPVWRWDHQRMHFSKQLQQNVFICDRSDALFVVRNASGRNSLNNLREIAWCGSAALTQYFISKHSTDHENSKKKSKKKAEFYFDSMSPVVLWCLLRAKCGPDIFIKICFCVF